MKTNRQEKILQLIQSRDIETQEQLLGALEAEGFHTTQATISRDIKQLRIVKALGAHGNYCYTTSPKATEHTFSAKLNLIFKQGVISINHAQNIIVVKTIPGMASAACLALDTLELNEILGTIAGDDTCFIVVRDTASAASLCSEISSQIGKPE